MYCTCDLLNKILSTFSRRRGNDYGQTEYLDYAENKCKLTTQQI